MTIHTRASGSTGGVGRRSFMLGAGSLLLSGCVSSPGPQVAAPAPAAEPVPPVRPLMYDALPDEQFEVPAVDVAQMEPRWWRQEVDYESDETPERSSSRPARNISTTSAPMAAPCAMGSASAGRAFPGRGAR